MDPHPLEPGEIDGLLVPPGKACKLLTGYLIRGMAGKFVDTISIFNRKRNSVKMNIH